MIQWIVLPFCLVFLFTACEPEPIQPDAATYYILPIGDSRVDGDRPNFESYRYEFWKRLANSQYKFDLVGPFDDNDHGAGYEDYLGQSFDDHHAGIGGDQTTDVLARLDDALNTVDGAGPDVILLGIGGNDLLGGADVATTIDNLNEIIDRIQTKNPNVTIFVEQIAPGQSNFMTAAFRQSFDQYNAAILNVATNQQTATSTVVAVDMAAGWQDAYLADDVHYNTQGAQVVADRYFAAMLTHVSITKPQ